MIKTCTCQFNLNVNQQAVCFQATKMQAVDNVLSIGSCGCNTHCIQRCLMLLPDCSLSYSSRKLPTLPAWWFITFSATSRLGCCSLWEHTCINMMGLELPGFSYWKKPCQTYQCAQYKSVLIIHCRFHYKMPTVLFRIHHTLSMWNRVIPLWRSGYIGLSLAWFQIVGLVHDQIMASTSLKISSWLESISHLANLEKWVDFRPYSFLALEKKILAIYTSLGSFEYCKDDQRIRPTSWAWHSYCCCLWEHIRQSLQTSSFQFNRRHLWPKFLWEAEVVSSQIMLRIFLQMTHKAMTFHVSALLAIQIKAIQLPPFVWVSHLQFWQSSFGCRFPK